MVRCSVPNTIGTITLAAVLLLALPAAGAADPPREKDAQREIYRPPQRPLDSRISPEKITVQDPPPLPQQVLLPLPATHRIAEDAGQVPVDATRWQRARAAIDRGIAFLRAAQDDGGSWMIGVDAAPTPPKDGAVAPASPVDVAITAFAVKAIVQADPDAAAEAGVERAVDYLVSARRRDGSFSDSPLANYVTSSVVSALASVDEFRFMNEIRAGTSWLQESQWDQGEGLDAKQDWFGGAGYGNRGRPDLSNSQMMLEALYDAGLSPDEPAFQRALSFLTRAQNLEQTNAAEWAGDDGGFIYTPANGGESFASAAAGEGRYGEIRPEGAPRSLRSYGSMTYAGFKSLLYAGLSPDDVRVRAAYDWIRRHFTFEENPGLGEQGLYYYYHAMARALRVGQQHVIEGLDGTDHNWREALIDAIAARQRDDGSWVNEADRWLEGEAVMATVYALLALEEAIKPVAGVDGSGSATTEALRFTVTLDPAIAETFTGRVYILLSSSARREPRFGPSWFGSEPFFAMDVEGWAAGEPLVLTSDRVLSFPKPMDEIPGAEWMAQAVIRLNPDSPSIGTGPGNAYSAVVRGRFDGESDVNVDLAIDRTVEPRPFRPTERVKLVEIPSPLLTAFHGREIVMRAAVVLPEGYEDHVDRHYPVMYVIGGFGSDHRMAHMMSRAWPTGFSDRLARVVLDPLCFGGHHVFADSDNNGPRGTALVTEFIPHLESTYRFVAAPTARFVSGHSSGGWSSLWLQIAYPDFFGGTWSTAPDPVDFRSFQRTDIYADGANAYVDADGEQIPVAQFRGAARAWYEDMSGMEFVYGEGGQLRSFDWVFSPPSGDGLPKRLCDAKTGAIDPAVAEAWKRYDIRLVLEENWTTLGPKLAGKINVIVGDRDTFFLHEAVRRLKKSLERLGSDAVIEIRPGKDHGSVLDPELYERIDREMVEAFERVHGKSG